MDYLAFKIYLIKCLSVSDNRDISVLDNCSLSSPRQCFHWLLCGAKKRKFKLLFLLTLSLAIEWGYNDDMKNLKEQENKKI
jgi:hypothetical protein